MTNYMALVFGMLMSSYLAAHRIDRVMIWIALAIYSILALGFCNSIFQAYGDFSRIGLVLAERGKLPESDLGWFGPVVGGAGSMHVIPGALGVMVLGACVGSIGFFFRERKAYEARDVEPVEREEEA